MDITHLKMVKIDPTDIAGLKNQFSQSIKRMLGGNAREEECRRAMVEGRAT